MAESLTLRKLVTRWNKRRTSLLKAGDSFPVEDGQYSTLHGQAYEVGYCADELAATLTGMTCETCAHRGMRLGNFNDCKLLKSEMPQMLNGQPFGCLAHTPRADRDKENNGGNKDSD